MISHCRIYPAPRSSGKTKKIISVADNLENMGKDFFIINGVKNQTDPYFLHNDKLIKLSDIENYIRGWVKGGSTHLLIDEYFKIKSENLKKLYLSILLNTNDFKIIAIGTPVELIPIQYLNFCKFIKKENIKVKNFNDKLLEDVYYNFLSDPKTQITPHVTDQILSIKKRSLSLNFQEVNSLSISSHYRNIEGTLFIGK